MVCFCRTIVHDPALRFGLQFAVDGLRCRACHATARGDHSRQAGGLMSTAALEAPRSWTEVPDVRSGRSSLATPARLIVTPDTSGNDQLWVPLGFAVPVLRLSRHGGPVLRSRGTNARERRDGGNGCVWCVRWKHGDDHRRGRGDVDLDACNDDRRDDGELHTPGFVSDVGALLLVHRDAELPIAVGRWLPICSSYEHLYDHSLRPAAGTSSTWGGFALMDHL